MSINASDGASILIPLLLIRDQVALSAFFMFLSCHQFHSLRGHWGKSKGHLKHLNFHSALWLNRLKRFQAVCNVCIRVHGPPNCNPELMVYYHFYWPPPLRRHPVGDVSVRLLAGRGGVTTQPTKRVNGGQLGGQFVVNLNQLILMAANKRGGQMASLNATKQSQSSPEKAMPQKKSRDSCVLSPINSKWSTRRV